MDSSSIKIIDQLAEKKQFSVFLAGSG